MCGIVGYIGAEPIGKSVVLDGLTALEYRGYDSAGIALISPKKKTIAVTKRKGEVSNLRQAIGTTTEQAAAIGKVADGVVVGSAIVEIIGEHGASAAPLVQDYVRSLADALARQEEKA